MPGLFLSEGKLFRGFGPRTKVERREKVAKALAGGATMNLYLRATKEGERLHLHVEGELTRADTAEFKSWAIQQVEGEARDVEIHMKRLHYLDSSGLGSLIFLRKLVQDRGGSLYLSEVSDWLRRFLKATGLEETFTGDQG